MKKYRNTVYYVSAIGLTFIFLIVVAISKKFVVLLQEEQFAVFIDLLDLVITCVMSFIIVASAIAIRKPIILYGITIIALGLGLIYDITYFFSIFYIIVIFCSMGSLPFTVSLLKKLGDKHSKKIRDQ